MTKPGDTNPVHTSNPSEVLRQVLKNHPPEILNQPEALLRVLMDHFPRAEVNLLISAARAGIPQQVSGARAGTPAEVVLAMLRNRMIHEQGFSETSAEWVVQAWFGALHTMEPPSQTVPQTTPQTAAETAAKRVDLPLEETRKTRSAADVAGNIVLVGVIGAGVLFVLGLFAYRALTVPPYEFKQLSFFDAAAPETDPWELRNFNSWCDFPAMSCANVTPFKVTAPYVHARLGVTYTTQRAAAVPLHCEATNSESQVVVSAETTGHIPDPMYPGLMSTGWMVPFKAPELGWSPGTYKVVCTTTKGNAEASFEVKQ